MKPDELYEKRQSAGRLEAALMVAAIIGGSTAILTLFLYGWVACLELSLLSAIVFGLSRLFALLDDLWAEIGKENRASSQSAKEGRAP